MAYRPAIVLCLYAPIFTNSADIVSESHLSKQLPYTGMYTTSVCNQGSLENHSWLAIAATINGFSVLVVHKILMDSTKTHPSKISRGTKMS